MDPKITRGAEKAIHLHKQGMAYSLAIWKASQDTGATPGQIAKELGRRAALRRLVRR